MNNAREQYTDRIKNVMETYNTVDIWRAKNPQSSKPIFKRNTYSATLDYCFTPEHLSNSVKTVSMQPTALSDHSMIIVDIGFPKEQRGPGFWHFNNTLLEDSKFLQDMKAHILEVQQEEFDNPSIKWEWIKHKIREFCIKFGIPKQEKKGLGQKLGIATQRYRQYS